jgi:hypothetical protein
VHSAKNYSKYFIVAVNETRSGNMNVAMINDKSEISLITIQYSSTLTHTQVNCTARNPQVRAHLTQPSFYFEVLKGQC